VPFKKFYHSTSNHCAMFSMLTISMLSMFCKMVANSAAEMPSPSYHQFHNLEVLFPTTYQLQMALPHYRHTTLHMWYLTMVTTFHICSNHCLHQHLSVASVYCGYQSINYWMKSQQSQCYIYLMK
jgi:hypothetical protein